MTGRNIVLGFVVLAACNDVTSDVGLGLLEDSTGPEVVQVAPSVFESIQHRDVTGAQDRLLAGYVNDPLTGAVRATAYADFLATLGTSISGDVTEAGLRLVVDYLYGDTLQAVTVAVHDILASWDEPGGRADTSLGIGDQLAAFTFAPKDSLVTVKMPDDWVDQHRAALGSLEFDTGFHGLAFSDVSRTSVVGFDSKRSILYVKTESDSVGISMDKTITGVKRLTGASPKDDLVLLQDGSGPSVRVGFDLLQYQGRPLNGATVRFPFELPAAPVNFVRPEASTLQLVMITDPDEPVIIITDLVRVGESEYSASDASLGNFLQDVFFSNVEYAWLELRVPIQNNTINNILLRSTNAGTPAPEALLVFSR